MSHVDAVIEAAAMALKKGDTEPLYLDGERAPIVQRALDAASGDPSLPNVVEELCLFACWIGSAKKSPTARDGLLKIAMGALGALKELGDRLTETLVDVRSAQASRDFSHLEGRAKERFEPRRPNPAGVRAGPLARASLEGIAPKKRPKPAKRR